MSRVSNQPTLFDTRDIVLRVIRKGLQGVNTLLTIAVQDVVVAPTDL